jgi:hypothetical protein
VGPTCQQLGREKAGRAKGATQKRKRKPVNAPQVRMLTGPVRKVAACGGRVGRHDGLAGFQERFK